jgi:hypothetical protein
VKRCFQSPLSILAGAVAGYLILEGILSLLPVSEGIYGAESSAAWPVHHLIPNRAYTYSMGWNLSDVQHGRSNNFGYAAPFDYVPGTSGIVLLGDSFVESLMNAYPDTIQGLLPTYLEQPAPVMHFGTSGAAMPDFLAVAGEIGKHFKATWAVVVITEHDFDQGFEPSAGYYAWDPNRKPPVRLTSPEHRSKIKQWLRQLSVVRYVRGNLKLTLNRLINVHDATATSNAPPRCDPVALSGTDAQLIGDFSGWLATALSLDASHIVLVLDSDRASIYAPTASAIPPCPTRDREALALLRADALAAGARVIDTTELFGSYYQRTGQRLDYSPVDMHWNGIANRLVAKEVAGVINDDNPRTAPRRIVHQ